MIKHIMMLEHSSKPDGRDLWVARCACGYLSAPGTAAAAGRAGESHLKARAS